MRERGIMFTGPMVRALLAGRKTQTRRAVRVPKVCADCLASAVPHLDGDGGAGLFGRAAYLRVAACNHGPEPVLGERVRCPYGKPGDRLWVRETWQQIAVSSEGTAPAIHTEAAAYATLDPADRDALCYRATGGWDRVDHVDDRGFDWRPSLLMPRWASRITLDILNVRVERAHDISDADIAAEGVDAEAVGQLWTAAKPKRRAEVEHLTDEVAEMLSPHDRWEFCWTLINGRESWDANPWCWVIEFKRVDAGGAK